ncbi:MAG: YdcF family protein, partial [Candidatus Omnitrophica bacterium]|nr:YdcF family protein [Candidatus Omnitrophota bacterium]
DKHNRNVAQKFQELRHVDGDRLTEAKTIEFILVTEGVPAGIITLEENSTNTRGNMIESQKVIEEAIAPNFPDASKPLKIWVITDGFHRMRAVIQALKQFEGEKWRVAGDALYVPILREMSNDELISYLELLVGYPEGVGTQDRLHGSEIERIAKFFNYDFSGSGWNVDRVGKLRETFREFLEARSELRNQKEYTLPIETIQLDMSRKERALVTGKDLDNLKKYIDASKIARAYEIVFEDRSGDSVISVSLIPHKLFVDNGLAARAPPYQEYDLASRVFQILIDDIVLRAVEHGWSAVTASDDVNRSIYQYFRRHPDELALLNLALKRYGIGVDSAYSRGLETYGSTSYPARLVISSEQRDTISHSQLQRFNYYLERARKETGIDFEVVQRSGQSVAVYHAGSQKLLIDQGLAAFAPDPTDQTLSRQVQAYEIFIQDLFAHAALYAQGFDKWSVWRKRAESFKKNPEDFLLLADVLSFGEFEIISEPWAKFHLDGIQGETSLENYLKVLRMSTSLKELKESNPLHPYFMRFSTIDRDFPFQTPIETNWLVSRDTVNKIAELMAQSAQNIALIDQLLKSRDQRLKVVIVIGIYQEKERLSPYSPENPTGEDALRVKINQLNEIFKGTNIDWEIIYVSRNASDPDRSGEVIEKLLHENGLGQYARSGQVHNIDIKDSNPTLGKGTQIRTGMRDAIAERSGHRTADVVVYTDADVTMDLRQLGLLLGPVVLDETNQLRVNDEGHFNSTVVANGSRYSDPNKKVLYSGLGFEDFALPAGLDPLPDAEADYVKVITRKFFAEPFLYAALLRNGINDTQIGFKAYPRDILRKILPKADERRFSFDTELLTLALSNGASFHEVSVLWSDSPIHSSLRTAEGRWENFLDFISQYRRLKHVRTIASRDLKHVRDIAQNALELARSGQSTFKAANDLERLVAEKFSEKYLSYAAMLKLQRNLKQIAAREDNLRRFLNKTGVTYHLVPRDGKVIARFNPKFQGVEIDEALALIAPDYRERSEKTLAFQSFIDDLLRHTTGETNVFTRQDSLEYLISRPDDAKRLWDFVSDHANHIQYVDSSYHDAIKKLGVRSELRQGVIIPHYADGLSRVFADLVRQQGSNILSKLTQITGLAYLNDINRLAQRSELRTGETIPLDQLSKREQAVALLETHRGPPFYKFFAFFRNFNFYVLGIVTKKAPGTQTLTSQEEYLLYRAGHELNRAGYSNIEKISKSKNLDPNVIDDVFKVIKHGFGIGRREMTDGQESEPTTFAERLNYLLERGIIKFAIDDLDRDESHEIVDALALSEFGHKNLKHDKYLYPRRDPNINPMGVLSFLTIDYISSKDGSL